MPSLKPSKIRFESRDGFPLQEEWHYSDLSTGSNEYVVLILPGMGILYRFYWPFTRHFVNKGFDVFLFDFRGIEWSSVQDLRLLETNAST
jgi:predicted alpha/beta hydrolase